MLGFLQNLTWMDGFILVLVVLFNEFIIKKLILKNNEKYKLIYTYAPIVLSAIAYIIYFIANGKPWYSGLLQGVIVGLTSMGSYDAILKIAKEQGLKDIKAIGEEVKNTVEKK